MTDEAALDRDAPDNVRRSTLTDAGWTAETLRHPEGRDVERWFGPSPRYRQPPCGLGLAAAWTCLCLTVEHGHDG